MSGSPPALRSHEAASLAPGAPGWILHDLSFRYPGAPRAALDEVSLELRASSCTAVIGPNGSGKSTLLRLLLGTLKPDRGTVRFGDRNLSAWKRRDLARNIGVVAQHEEITFPISVHELVAMGRYPHLGLLRSPQAADRAAVDVAIRRCDVQHLRERRIDTLSGGERQRARIARALAQQPRVLALDEPTLALDVRHEMEIFELVRDLATTGVTVIIVTHNLNLAARYADALVLLDRGAVAAAGAPAEVMRGELLERVYEWPLRTGEHPGPGPDTGAVQVTPLARTGDREGRI